MHNRIQAALLKEAALKNLDNFQLTPLPDNYRLWFEYASSSIEGLNAAIDERIAERKAITDALCKKLFTQFLATKDQKDIDEARIAFGDMLSVMIDHICGWDVSNNQFCAAMTSCIDRLEQNPGIDELKEIITEVTTEARKSLDGSQAIKSTLHSLSTEIANLRQDVDKLGNQALTDALTQVANRRGFDNALTEQIEEANKSDQPLSLLVVDIDDFKQINDQFGHQIGDKILKYVAATLRNHIRGNDLLARYGGEEFTVLLPQTGEKAASHVAENLLTAISARQLTTGTNNQVIGRITASVGLACYQSGETAKAFFNRADQAMYSAKRNGKNRVCA